MSDIFAKCALSGFQQVFQTQNQREQRRIKEKFSQNGGDFFEKSMRIKATFKYSPVLQDRDSD